MTEKELLIHAKNYIDKLANGINPLTGEPVPKHHVPILCLKLKECIESNKLLHHIKNKESIWLLKTDAPDIPVELANRKQQFR